MTENIFIIKKEEAYSYDELKILEERLLPLIADGPLQAALQKTLCSLKESLADKKDSMALFFMPQNTFNIFSLIQGDKSICKITQAEVEALYKAFDSIDNYARVPIYSHLRKKLQVLNDYLQQGNSVTPTAIAAENLSQIEL